MNETIEPRVHVPLYVDPDVSLNQSNLILAHLARKTDMLGDTERESLAIQEIMAHCYDALFHWSGMLGVIIRTNIYDKVAQARFNAFNVLCNWYKAFDRPVFSPEELTGLVSADGKACSEIGTEDMAGGR